MTRRANIRKRVVITVAGVIGAYLILVSMLAYQYVHPVPRRSSFADGFRQELLPTPLGETPLTWSPSAPLPHAKAVFLFAHGYGGNRAHWQSLMSGLRRRGYDSVAIAMPGQDESKISAVGFGSRESDTIIAVGKAVRQRYPAKTRLIAVGVSLGGAATWIAAGREPQLFDAVVTEASYANLEQTSRRYVSLKLPSAAFVLEPIVLLGQRIAGINPAQWHPVDYAPKYRRGPRVLIHCEQDDLVTRDVTDALARAADAEVYVAKGTKHARFVETSVRDYLTQLDRVAARLTSPNRALAPQSTRSRKAASDTAPPRGAGSTR